MADQFTGGLQTLLSLSYHTQSQWKEKRGKQFKHVNAVRWGAGHDRNQDIMENFPRVEEFLRECKVSDGSPSKKAQRLVVSAHEHPHAL